MNSKTTKRALLSSVVAMLVCFTMLLSTTFAWFTDTAVSASNIIQSGKLDIELEYYNGTEWKDVNASSEILDKNALWEPGYTEVVYLRIKNAGSLALKYQLGINVVSETAGINVAGDNFKLSDYIYMGVIENVNGETNAYANREDAVSAVADAGIISTGFTKSGSMVANADALYLAMVVYMPETVDNVANHNGTKIPEIDLGISVFATQLTYENDTFGPDYDEDADIYHVIVSSEAELVQALANAKNGDIIGISGNVTWTTGAVIGSTPFVTDATYITLKGVDANATFTAIGSGVGKVGIDNGTVIFKDLKIVDNSVSYAEDSWEYGYLEFRGNTVFENCDVVNAIMMDGESAKFIDCKLNSNDNNQYAVWVSNGVATFENCTFSGARGLKVHEDYGSEVVSVSANNSEFVELSKKPGVALGTLNAETSVSLTNNKFIGTQPGDQGNYKYETDTDVTTFKFTDKDNTVITNTGSLSEGLYKDENGVYYATTTGGLSAGISATAENGTLVLAKDIAYTGNGYPTINKNITLDLNGNTISTTSMGVVAKAGTIKNGTVSNPVGSRAAIRTWSGVSIENVTVVSPKNGGITVASGNTLPYIKNVTIEAETYGIELQYGASVGNIENVNIVAGKNGIVAQAATVDEIKNCTINGEECGVWGQLKGVYDLKLSFTNCDISGENYGLYVCDEGATIVPDGKAYINYDEVTSFEGGIKDKEYAFGQSGKLVINGSEVAAFISTADGLFAFANDVNVNGNKYSGKTVVLTNDIDLNNAAWTPIGQTGATEFKGVFDGQGYTIKNLYVDNSAYTDEHTSSGLFGWAESGVTIKNVNIDGATVKGNHNVAALVGYTYSAKVSNCHISNATIVCNHANDDACGDKSGTIVGYAGDESRFSNCSASDSTITAGRDAGQLIGAGYNVSVSNCSASNVTVSATGDCNREGNINNTIIGRVLG